MIHLLVILAATSFMIPDDGPLVARIPCLRGPFHGITPTNEIGEIVGPVDRGDWGCLRDRSHGRGFRTLQLESVPAPPPTDICLEPAAPNPASVQTRLQFTLPQAASPTLVIYGRTGGGPRRVAVVRTLVDGAHAAGAYTVVWDLKDDRGGRVPAGIYRAVLTVNGESLCGDIQVQ